MNSPEQELANHESLMDRLRSSARSARALLEAEKAKLFLMVKAEADAVGSPISIAHAQAIVKAEMTGKLNDYWQAYIEAQAAWEAAKTKKDHLIRVYWDTKD